MSRESGYQRKLLDQYEIPAWVTGCLVDFDDLFPEVFSMQKPEKCLRHSLDAVEDVFFEANFPLVLPGGQALQCFITLVPPIKDHKTVDARPRDD